MIKRTSKKYMKELLKNNPDWSVLDIGCGRYPWEEAQTLCDIVDHRELHCNKRFVQCEASVTPFMDGEFDFVVASHITEHVASVDKFLKEITRIGKRGYIEVPTPLFDNLTHGNRTEHLWWLYFDDVNNELNYNPKIVTMNEQILPTQLTAMEMFFRNSMVLELYWEDNIQYKKLNPHLEWEQKVNIWPEKDFANKTITATDVLPEQDTFDPIGFIGFDVHEAFG